MAITKMSNSGIATGGVLKYDSMLAGNPAYDPAMFFSIATLQGNNSANSITFSDIPQTYKHLQIRYIARITSGGTGGSNMQIRLNGSSSNIYAFHSIAYSSGGSLTARSAASQTQGELIGSNANNYPSGSDNSHYMGIGIVDILDYSSTTKTKVVRGTGGYDTNSGTSQGISIGSTLFNSTNAITSLTLLDANGFAYTALSSFALYGIKG